MPGPMENRPERAKSRASRISLKYYTRPDRFYRARFGISLIITLLAIGVTAFSFWASQGSLAASRHFRLSSLASPGPVAKPHALFEARCEACHRTAESLNPERSASIFHASGTTSAKCMDCHRSGPHHPNSKVESAAACASCHEDHNGRDNNLTVMADLHCTSCHKDLGPSQVSPSDRSTLAITSFNPGNHPEFRVHRATEKKPQQLKFNHALHLAPGQNLTPGGKALVLYKQLSTADQVRYGLEDKSIENLAVSLNCNSCHHSEPDDPFLVGLNIREPLKNPLPVKFERDCAACHPLSISADEKKTTTARHGLQLGDLAEELQGFAFQELAKEKPSLLEKNVTAVEIPGKKPVLVDANLKNEVSKKVDHYLELLIGVNWRVNGPNGKRGCVECHEFEKSADQNLPFSVKPPAPTTIALTAARFDHSRHALVDCKSCHEAGASKAASDMLLPKIENCFSCHSEKGLSRGASASAGSSCVTCHGYHDLGPGVHAKNLTKPVSEFPEAIQSLLKQQ